MTDLAVELSRKIVAQTLAPAPTASVLVMVSGVTRIDARILSRATAFLAGSDFEFLLFESVSDELVGGLRVNPVMARGTAEIAATAELGRAVGRGLM